MNRPFALSVLGLSLGCGSAVLPNNTTDASSADAPALQDTLPLIDISTPEAPGMPDVVSSVDTELLPDALVRDVLPTEVSATEGGLPDGDGPSIEGLWRAVGWTFTPPSGTSVRITDRDTPVVVDPSTGRTAPFRINGILNLRSTRVSLAAGVLASDHFYATQNMDGTEGYSAWGVTAPGLYDRASQTFRFPAAPMPLRFNVMDSNHLSFGEGSGSVTFYERTTSLGGRLGAINVQCAAQIRHPLRSAPMVRPRIAVLWDQPSASSPRRETLGYALTFRTNYAGFPVTLGPTPDAEVIHTLDGVRVAVAHPIAYDDLNEDGRYTPPAVLGAPPPDTLRGVSSIAIVWIDPMASSLGSTRFADLQPGYQYVHVHMDHARGSEGFSPFDLTRAVCVDLAVEDEGITTPIPNVLR